MPLRPQSWACLMTSHGVDSSASCSAATGRITSVANRRQSALNSRWSSVSAKSIENLRDRAAGGVRLTGQSTSTQFIPPPPRIRQTRSARGAVDYGSRIGWAYWKWRGAIGAGVVVALVGIGVAAYFLVDALKEEPAQEAPAPRIVIHEKRPQPQAAQELGFPEFATKNTTRVSGVDPVADAAAVALAVFPSTGGVAGPDAVSLVDENDWKSGIAAASLAGPPVSAPILISSRDGVPTLTTDALKALGPSGSAATQSAQLFEIGNTETPSGLDREQVSGKTPAEIAAEVDALRQKLTGTKPKDVLLVST